jgi:hypothetical protein
VNQSSKETLEPSKQIVEPITGDKSPNEAPMEILYGSPSCLDRVYIAPPKPNQTKLEGFFQNPNENLVSKSTPNKRLNNNCGR